MIRPVPISLIGSHIRLVPLLMSHAQELDEACRDRGKHTIWRYLLDSRIYQESGMAGVIKTLLARQQVGTDVPFAIIELRSGRAVGTTRFMEIDIPNRVVEIGTWMGFSYQGTGINLESKYLMLRHAFEALHVLRVQFKVDHRNFPSMDAMEKLRACREGVLRNHIVLGDGTLRSSVYYSILDNEWPAVEIHIEGLMERASRQASPADQEIHSNLVAG